MKDTKKPGFTLIELTLALVFVSMLLLSISWLTIHITSTYEKGLAIKAVNSVGKELIDDFSRSIAASPAMPVDSLCGSIYPYSTASTSPYQTCMKDKASKMVYQQRYGKVLVKDKEETVPVSGIFCTGRYSYIWNTAYALNTEDYKPVGINDYRSTYEEKNGFGATTKSEKNFRLLKVSDFSRELCISHMEKNKYLYDEGTTFTINENDDAYEMLDNSENNLAIYDLRIFPPTVHSLTSSAFYSGTFILATLRGNIDIASTGDFCSDPPDNLNTDFAYCAINKFNFAMRAAGEKTSNER